MYNSDCIYSVYIIISDIYFNSFMNCYLLLYVIVPLRDSVLFCSVLFGFFISFPSLFFFILSILFIFFLFSFSSFFLSITIQLLNGSGLTCVVYCRFEVSGSRVVTVGIRALV